MQMKTPAIRPKAGPGAAPMHGRLDAGAELPLATEMRWSSGPVIGDELIEIARLRAFHPLLLGQRGLRQRSELGMLVRTQRPRAKLGGVRDALVHAEFGERTAIGAQSAQYQCRWG